MIYNILYQIFGKVILDLVNHYPMQKGLGKLKYYCQLCEKQCKDANGFKCHSNSEGHKRLFADYSENPQKYIKAYSDQFLRDFVQMLSFVYKTKTVPINTVYNEFIKDKDHIHLKSTKWSDLESLGKHLQEEGHCTLEHTAAGLSISWIDKIAISKEKKRVAMRDLVQEQLAVAEPTVVAPEKQKLERIEGQSISFGLSKKEKTHSGNIFGSERNTVENIPVKRKVPRNVERLIQEEEEKSRKKRNRNWIKPNIWIKVLDRDYEAGKYYKRKGIIRNVLENIYAVVEIEEEEIIIEQRHCETVVPHELNKHVLILHGNYTNCIANIIEFMGRHEAKLKIIDGLFSGIETILHYDDFSLLTK